MVNLDISFALLHVSIFFIVVMIGVTLRIKNKVQIHFAFLSLMGLVLIWSLGQLLEIYTRNVSGRTQFFFIYVYFFGLDFVPVNILLMGLIFAQKKINLTFKYFGLFIPPILSFLILLTNNYHHLFFEHFALNNNYVVFGKYFYVHTFINYVYIIIGSYHLIYFTINNSGFFSKQSLLITFGIMISFLTNIISTLKLVKLPFYSTPVTFCVAILFIGLAIFKFRFLNVIPIALEKVVDNMSDSFIVVDEDLKVIDYNKTLFSLDLMRICRNEIITTLLKSQKIVTDREAQNLIRLMQRLATQKKKKLHLQRKINDRYFEIDVSPIFSKREYLGAIFLIKDVTQHKTDLEIIRATQNQLIERARLMSLGELAAGIAHDINSPLSVLQTIFHVMDTLIKKGSQEISTYPQLEPTFNQLKTNCEIGTNACQRMIQIVNSVRNNTRNVNAEIVKIFYIDEIMRDLELLMNHYFKESKCSLLISGDRRCTLKGDPGKLSQVLTNLILNAIQAYGATPGSVEINLQNLERNVLITISDKARGIDEKYRDGIFKNILTTKGTQGTGLGLYISYAIITGHFQGKIWFESAIGVGTTFFITIPKR